MRSITSEHYADLYATMQVVKSKLPQIQKAAQLIVAKKAALYVPAQARTGVPWPMFGLTHYRECTCDPSCQILNGEPYRQRTRLVPVGRGPWPSWDAAALDAAKEQGWHAITKWNIPVMLAELEQFNGYGYRYRDVESSYLWSMTNHSRKGKFVADGVYDPEAVDKQAGCAPILKCIKDMGRFEI